MATLPPPPESPEGSIADSIADSPAAPPEPLSVDRHALREPRRVSPFGPIFLGWAVIRQLGVVNIGIATAVAGFGNLELVGLVGAAVVAIAGLARWLRFTYHLESTDDGDQIVTLGGVMSRNRTVVPLDRVQSVSTRQNLLHRIFGLVEVNVQTAGSAGAEVQLSAVRPEVAQRLRRLSTATSTSGAAAPMRSVGGSEHPGDTPAPPPEATPLLRRSTRDILRVAFTRNPIVLLAPIPLAFGLAVEAEELLAGLSDRVVELLEDIGGGATAVIGLVLVIVLISAAVSVSFVVLRLHDLRLVVDGAGLRRMSGLISRTETTASVERVQVLAVRRNPLERRFGQHELVLPLAGAGAGGSIESAAGVASALSLPGSTSDEVEAVADIVFGADRSAEVGHDEARGISPLAVRRWTLWIGVAPALVAAAGLWWLIGPWSLSAAFWVVLVRWAAGLVQRSWRWTFGPESLRVEAGVVTRSRQVMPVRKTQNVSLKRGIFHRRYGLADLRVRTASRVQVRIPMLPIEQARALRDELLLRAETDPRPFM